MKTYAQELDKQVIKQFEEVMGYLEYRQIAGYIDAPLSREFCQRQEDADYKLYKLCLELKEWAKAGYIPSEEADSIMDSVLCMPEEDELPF